MTDTHTLTARRPVQIRSADAETPPGRTARSTTVTPGATPVAPALPSATLPSWNLTPQQWRVFLLVGRALSNKAIAHELKVAESTVKAHISAIFKVSGCRNRTEAALLSLRVRYGLLEPEAEARGSMAALDDLRRQAKARKSA